MKRTPLKRGTKPLQRKTPLVSRPRSQSSESRSAYAAVMRRSTNRCEIAHLEVCTVNGQHTHHVLLRSRGGRDTENNLLRVCLACHSYAHMNPAVATKMGWIRHAWDLETDPSNSIME